MTPRFATAEDLAWLSERAAVPLTALATGVAVVDAAGRTRGVVAFDDFRPNSAEAHMAVDTPIAWRELAPAASRYAFDHEGKGVVLAGIRASHAASVQTARHLGFREIHRVKDGWARGVDLIVLELRREHCRWVSKERQAA